MSAKSALTPVIANAGTGKAWAVVGSRTTCLISGEQTGGAFSFIEILTGPNDPGTPLHTHTREDESFYVLEGEFEFHVDGRTFNAGPGSFVFGPRNIPHNYRNVGGGKGRLLVMMNPAGFEKFFEAVSDTVPPPGQLPPPPSKQHIDKVMAEAAKFGLIIHPPA